MPLVPGGTLLDACVLALLEREDMYGYLLTQNMQAVLPLSESTLYPVLRRLEKDGCLRVYDRQHQGRNRRYYAITSGGRERLKSYRAQWREYQNRISALLLPKEEEGK